MGLAFAQCAGVDAERGVVNNMSDAEQIIRKARETLERLDDCEAEFATRNATRRPRGFDWGANVPKPVQRGLSEAEVATLVHVAVGKAVAAALRDLNAEVEALAKDVGEVTGKMPSGLARSKS